MKLPPEDVVITLECLPEDIPIRGNAVFSGDPDFDRRVENKIIAKLDHNEWAWCCVRVTARWKKYPKLAEDEYLGCCSYANEDAFRKGGYFEDMCSETTDRLQTRLRAVFSALKEYAD